MGQAGSVAKLVDSGIRFLTAAPRSEIVSYDVKLPVTALSELTLGLTPDSYKEDFAVVSSAVAQDGMERVNDKLFVLDLGVSERKLEFEHHDSDGEPEYTQDELTGGALAIRSTGQARNPRRERLVVPAPRFLLGGGGGPSPASAATRGLPLLAA